MATITAELFEILKSVQRPGDFYATGTADVFPPALEIEGIGRIALPLLAEQAQQLINVAEQAPYGLGEATLTDLSVRRTWQIDARKVALSGKYWSNNLQSIVQQAASQLGVKGDVNAELYKLLVYDAGSFFVPHRDTEKTAGMFATLIIVLPSLSEGGELVVRHQQRQVVLDLRCDDAAEIRYAAFYADCVHEVRPVTRGHRLVLVYNLLRSDKKQLLPTPPDYSREQSQLTKLLRSWTNQAHANVDEVVPEKLIYLLEHAYSLAELRFDTLKNADAAMASVLVSAAACAECDIHLALVSIEESGTAEHTGRWRDNNFDVGEVFERVEQVCHWQRPDGQLSLLPPLPVSLEEFSPPGEFENLKPDDIEFHEATGNEGASFERNYRHAALVIWPKASYLAIINQAGFKAAQPILTEFSQHFATDATGLDSPHWHDAHTLAGYMLRDWLPNLIGARPTFMRDDGVATFVSCLNRLRDREHLIAVWTLIATKGFHCNDTNAALAQSTELLPWRAIVDWTERAIDANAANAPEVAIDILARLSVANPTHVSDLCAAARGLLMALPKDKNAASTAGFQPSYTKTASPLLVVSALQTFGAIDPSAAQEALDYFLAWPITYNWEATLLPATLQLTESPNSRTMPFVARLRDVICARLSARIALPLVPPSDWRRENPSQCKCQSCLALRNFLDSSTHTTWSLKAAEHQRRHVENEIRVNQIDVDCATDTRGRPYSLVCRKNQASYTRRTEQRKCDLENLERLAAAK